jgi:AraC-like DNA-binding protein
MFPRLFGINAAELSNRSQHLMSVIPDTASYITEHFHNGQQSDQIQELFDLYFLRTLVKTQIATDPRFDNAVGLILQNFGVVDVEKLDTGISSRQLRRLFNFYIGDSAKSFSRVVRFQNILKAKPSTQSLRQNKLFFDAGYYDQAHFIKEFKNFYGVTPSRAFGR